MKIMKSSLLGAVIVVLLTTPASAQSCTSADDFISKNTYEILRKGKPIGSHVISFYGGPHAMKVKAQTEMKVEVMFITAFIYNYDSTEIYCNGTLESAMTYVDDNGKDKYAEVIRSASNYQSQSYKGSFVLEPPFYTSNHWHPDVVLAEKILNTATGKLEGVTVMPPQGTNEADNFMYQVRGDIDYNTHYDAQGQWLGMTFDHPKGGAMEFRCVDCRNTPTFAIQPLTSSAVTVKYSPGE